MTSAGRRPDDPSFRAGSNRLWCAGRSRGEGGSATVLMLGIVCALLTLTLSGLDLCSAVVASHRARAAVDLSALAGAGVLMHGGRAGHACAAAARVAAANGARITRCSSHAGRSLVVAVVVQPMVPGIGDAVASARAGPALAIPVR